MATSFRPSQTEQPTDPALDPSRPSTMEAGWPARIAELVDRMPWIESLGQKVSDLLDPLFAHPRGRQAKDLLNGRLIGHALHPVLTDLPIGFWSGSLLLDLAGASRSAGVLSAAGSVSAIATAATGVADWKDTYGRDRRLGTVHGVVNLAGLAFHLASLGARLRLRRRRARRLSLVGFSITTAAAYLGGELVFKRGSMIDRNAWTFGPDEWTPVLPEAELAEGGTRKVDAGGRQVLLHRQAGLVHAIANTCPHAGGPLDEGTVSGGIVTCPWHGSQFRLTDGAVCHGPSTFPALRYQARVRKGQIEVRGRSEA